MYLTKDEIFPLYKSGELIIRPLLSEEQFGEMTLDLRLGTDFLVSFQGREPYIDATGDVAARPISSFFQETKRLIGETFFLHPHQTVLCSTLEYLKLPNDVFVSISTRSSFSRLGLLISSIVQPGYCGCLSLELTNHNNNAIKIRVGSAILQARFFKLSKETNYFSGERKYACQVRPVPSKANLDKEISILQKMSFK